LANRLIGLEKIRAAEKRLNGSLKIAQLRGENF
jgi:hypothetical protein